MIDKKDLLRDLKEMKRKCLKNTNYKPEDDIAYLVAKYNLDWDYIWKRTKKMLTL